MRIKRLPLVLIRTAKVSTLKPEDKRVDDKRKRLECREKVFMTGKVLEG